MDFNEKEAQRREQDQALNRALIWVGAAIVLEFLIVLVNKYYFNPRVTEEAINIAVAIYSGIRILRWVGLASLVVGLVWAALRWKRCTADPKPVILAIAGGMFWLCSKVILEFQEPGVRMLLWMIPGCAGLALVFYLYQREFFLSAVTSGLGVLGLWFARHTTMPNFYTIGAAVCIGAMGVLMVWLKIHGGFVSQKPGREAVVGPDAGYPLMFLSCVISLLVIGAACFMNMGMSYYLLYVMVAWLFALLVYYTVKMM